MADFTSTVPAPYVDATGAHIPAFQDILTALQNDYRSVYGADVVLDADTQDGQWIGIQAAAFNDYGAAFLAAYNAFSPATAQGAGLSSVVKTNGITRAVASYSTCDLTLVGQAGQTITSGQARDEAGYLWNLPAIVVFPFGGSIVATATCTTLGAIAAPVGSIDQIATPTLGWQSVTNVSDAAVGAPVESDPALKSRQTQSTMLGATGVVDGIAGAIAALLNVQRSRVYENDTNAPDANGIPGHTISCVVDGGDSYAIAQAIASRKLSAGTYGTTPVIVTSGAAAIPRTISFFRPSEPEITWGVSVKALPGFTVDVQAQIAQALSDWTNALGTGVGQAGRIMLLRAAAPALLSGVAATTFELLELTVARDGAVLGSADVAIAFNEAPLCDPSFVTVTPI